MMAPVWVAWVCTEAVAAPAQPAIALDFGPENQATLSGFQSVTPWTTPPGVRWEKAPPSTRDAGSPDPLLRDGFTDGTIIINLPDGKYTIAALIDDIDYGQRPLPGQTNGVRLQGTEVMTSTWPKGEALFQSRWYAHAANPNFGPSVTTWDRHVATAAPWRTHEVEVSGGELRISPFGGAPLTALWIGQVGRATAEVELALVDAARRQWTIDHRPDFPPPEAARAAAGLTSLQAMSWDQVPDPSRTPIPHERSAVPGQRYTWLIAVHGDDTPAAVEVTGPDGHALVADEVRWMDISEEAVVKPRPFVLRPLREGSLVGGQALVPMIAVHGRVPKSARAGSMPIQVRVTRGTTTLDLTLTLQIRDLQLEPPASRFGVWADLRSHAATVYGPDDPRTRAIFERDVAMLLDHGVSQLNLRGTFFPGPWPDVTSAPDPGRITWAVETWRRAGGGPFAWVDTFMPLYRAINTRDGEPALTPAQVEGLKRWLQLGKDLDLEVYLEDEHVLMKGPAEMDFLIRFLDDVSRANQDIGARVSVAEPRPGPWESLRETVDVVYMKNLPWVRPEYARWWTGRAQPYAYNLGLLREDTSVLPWIMETEAVVLWHYNEPYSDPYNDVRRTQWQMAMLAPDGASVWSTVRLERLAEGAEDMRYLSTVSALVRELHEDRRPAVQRLVRSACTLLGAVHSSGLGQRPDINRDYGLYDEASLDRVRSELGAIGESLAPFSARQRMWRRGQTPPPVSGFFPAAICEARTRTGGPSLP